MLDVTEVRRRLVQTIDQIKKDTATRRQATDRATADYHTFLTEIATPVCRHFVTALRAQGLGFRLSTPAGSIKMTSDRSAGDEIELTLDPERHPPTAIGRVSYGRGSRLLEEERPIREDKPVGELTDEDVLAFLLSAIPPFIER
jgi:hypothetical protein